MKQASQKQQPAAVSKTGSNLNGNRHRASSSIRNFLGGDFLKTEKNLKMLPFILFLGFLAVLYIANSYWADKTIRRIESTQRDMKELWFEYISTRSKLMQMSKQSQVAKSLAGTGIKESTVPPLKIMEDTVMQRTGTDEK
jgi:hypothetical protein